MLTVNAFWSLTTTLSSMYIISSRTRLYECQRSFSGFLQSLVHCPFTSEKFVFQSRWRNIQLSILGHGKFDWASHCLFKKLTMAISNIQSYFGCCNHNLPTLNLNLNFSNDFRQFFSYKNSLIGSLRKPNKLEFWKHWRIRKQNPSFKKISKIQFDRYQSFRPVLNDKWNFNFVYFHAYAELDHCIVLPMQGTQGKPYF